MAVGQNGQEWPNSSNFEEIFTQRSDVLTDKAITDIVLAGEM
jgi:hypothetical protein